MNFPNVPADFHKNISADGKRVSLAGRKLTRLPEWLRSIRSVIALDVSGTQLTSLPEWLGDLGNLTSLKLARNNITALPESIGKLHRLVELDLKGNQIVYLPKSFSNLKNLIVLDLSANQLASLPDWFGNLSALTELNLRNTGLRSLPECLRGLDGLAILRVSQNYLTSLPGWLGDLTSLVELALNNNQLRSLPESIGSLAALTDLTLNSNQLTQLPSSMANLTALRNLYLDKNPLTALPRWLDRLTGLTGLYLSQLQLTNLPDFIGNLTGLKDLYLHYNKLTSLPESIGKLTKLTTLYLRSNPLIILPESIGELTALISLDLGYSYLTVLPESIGKLAKLTTLYLRDSQLTALPESLRNLTALSVLDLGKNRLTELPESVGSFTELTSLNLAGNQIARLPGTLAERLVKGLNLDISDNPLDDPLPELVNRGADALAAYLSSLGDATAQYEGKLLLVGEGNVGKTSLVAALRGAPFIEGRSTTHGIEIWPLTFRHPERDVDITLRAWDFGGQEVYRVTHQFFFSARALYAVVWNARQGQEQDEVDGWLRRIRLRAGKDAPTIVVATHCDERSPELDYPHLQQAFPNMLVGSFDVDSRTETGIANLREAVSQQGAKLPQMGQLISPRWLAARDEVLARAKAEPQIRFKEFVKICERQGITGQSIVTLAQLMHDLGHIIYYGDDEGLRDVIVLNPEWLTKAISYVLEDKETRDENGVLDHARLRQIWGGRQGAPGYPARYHRYFLRLMEKFDISYRLEDDELHSLVAQLVTHERPRLPWQFRTQPVVGKRALALICRLSEPAPGLIPWLTVRHHRASTGLHWRRGVFLRHPIAAYDSEALVELRHSNELAVEVHAPSPDLYFNVLRDSIEDLITIRWPGLTYQLFIPCPGKANASSVCPGQFPLDGLLRLRERDMTSVPCMDCAEVHEISLLLTGFTVPDQPLAVELDQMQDQLNRIESGILRAEGQAAETAEYVRRVLRVTSAEVTDCPRIFTLSRERATGARRARFYEDHYLLTLWCEHSDHLHPWDKASYRLDPSKKWFSKVGPYALLIFKTLQLVVPLVGSIAIAALPPEQIESAQAHLDLMKTIVEDLPGTPEHDVRIGDMATAAGQMTIAEGEGLRAIRAILFDQDGLRYFGGLRRVQSPSADFLWVCPLHYPEYDPGLPIVP